MPFITRPGLNGRIYVPEQLSGQKKHNCKSCFSCQVCSDDRCSLCLTQSDEKGSCCRVALRSSQKPAYCSDGGS